MRRPLVAESRQDPAFNGRVEARKSTASYRCRNQINGLPMKTFSTCADRGEPSTLPIAPSDPLGKTFSTAPQWPMRNRSACDRGCFGGLFGKHGDLVLGGILEVFLQVDNVGLGLCKASTSRRPAPPTIVEVLHGSPLYLKWLCSALTPLLLLHEPIHRCPLLPCAAKASKTKAASASPDIFADPKPSASPPPSERAPATPKSPHRERPPTRSSGPSSSDRRRSASGASSTTASDRLDSLSLPFHIRATLHELHGVGSTATRGW